LPRKEVADAAVTYLPAIPRGLSLPGTTLGSPAAQVQESHTRFTQPWREITFSTSELTLALPPSCCNDWETLQQETRRLEGKK